MQKQQHSSRRGALWMAAACLALAGLLAGCGGGPRTSEDGAFRYELEDGGKAVITGCEAAGAAVSIPAVVDGRLVSAVAAGAIPDGVYALTLPEGVALNGGALSECSTLRCVVLPQGARTPALPEGCRALRSGEAYGESVLTGVFADESGALFALLDEGARAVLLAVPEGADSYEVPYAAEGVLVTGLDAAALDGADDLETLVLHEEMSFPPELLDALRALPGFSYPEDTLTADYVLTAEAAERINEQRAAAGVDGRIEPDMDLVRAARVRKDEQAESYSFQRPDGSPGTTVLDEVGADYRFKTDYHSYGDDLDAMAGDLTAVIAENESDPDALIRYERIGLSAGYGPYSEEEDFTAYAILTNSTQDELTFGSVRYEFRDGQLMPVSPAQEDVLWLSLYGEINGAAVGGLPGDFFDDCPGLEAVLLSQDSPHEDQIPDGVAVVRMGEDTGDGAAVSLWVHDYEGGMVYVKTDRDRYVLWDIDPNADSTALQFQIDGLPVTYINSSAIAYARSLERLIIPFDCGFSPSMSGVMNELEMFFYKDVDGTGVLVEYDDEDYFNALYFSLEFTNELVSSINELREESGLERMTMTSYELTRAARTLAMEQAETFGTTRPNGESWTTALNEEYVDWSSGYIWLKKYDESNIDEFTAEAIAEVFAPARDDGSLYHTAAMGVYMTEDLTLYVCALGIVF